MKHAVKVWACLWFGWVSFFFFGSYQGKALPVLEHKFKQGLGGQFYMFFPHIFFRARKKVTLRNKAQVSWSEKEQAKINKQTSKEVNLIL